MNKWMENLSRETENIKNNEMEILNLKKTISEIKNLQD